MNAAPPSHHIQSQTPAQSSPPATQAASLSSVQQASASLLLVKFALSIVFLVGEFLWAILKKILCGVSFIAFLVALPRVGLGLLGISLVFGYFIGTYFWISFFTLAIMFYLANDNDEFDGFFARTLFSLFGSALFTGLIFACLFAYTLYHHGNEITKVENTENVKAVDPRQAIATNPAPKNIQQADAEKENAPAAQDNIPVIITDAPVAQVATPKAAQESIDGGDTGDISNAGSTVWQMNMNAYGARGWLGLDAQPLTLESASPILDSAPRGMIIRDIAKGGPADMAGMVEGDLLVSVNGKTIETRDEIQDVVSNIPEGRTVPIKIIREGRAKYLLLTITQRPQP